MSTIEIFAKSVFWVFMLGGLCLVLGKSVPDRWLLPNRSRALQHLLIGWSLLVVALRFPFREQLPVRVGVAVLALIGLYSVAKWGFESVRKASSDVADRRWKLPPPASRAAVAAALAVLLPSLLIAFFPLFSSGAVYFQYRGPDLDGDFMSASFVTDGNGLGRLIGSLHEATGSFRWWDLGLDPWTIPDFREAVAIEFFLRSIRWGHAVLTALVSISSGEPVWFGFLVVVLFSLLLCPLVVLDACRARGIELRSAVLLSIAAIGSQTYALMLYEGIAVQLIAMPVLLFFVLNARPILLERSTLGAKFALALMLSALVSTFGEGIQILVVFAGAFLALYFGFREKLSLPRADVLGAAITIGALWIALSPTVFVDFALWSYERLKVQFSGGALHFNWSTLSLLFSLPYMALDQKDGLHLAIPGLRAIRLAELGILLAVAALCLRRRRGLEFSAVVACVAVFTLVNHRYALWKSIAVLQPLFLVTAFELLPARIRALPKEWLLAGLCAVTVGGMARLMWQYHLHAERVTPEQFEVRRLVPPGTRVAIVTPSQSRVYMKLGSLGELYWVNNWAWRRADLIPDFSIGGAASLPVVLYFDCDGEGAARCAAIKAFAPGLAHRTMVPTHVPVSSLLDKQGFVDQQALSKFVSKSFGVEPNGDQRPSEPNDKNRIGVLPRSSLRKP